MIRFVSYPINRAFTSIAVLLALFCFTPAIAEEGQVVGFEDMQGKTYFLHDFRGKPVLINLWATWCEPCVRELPSLAKLQQENAARGLVVMVLSEDDSPRTAQDFLKKKGISLTPFYDKGHAVYTALLAVGLPTTVLVTPAGEMIKRVEGPVDWQSEQAQGVLNEILVNH